MHEWLSGYEKEFEKSFQEGKCMSKKPSKVRKTNKKRVKKRRHLSKGTKQALSDEQLAKVNELRDLALTKKGRCFAHPFTDDCQICITKRGLGATQVAHPTKVPEKMPRKLTKLSRKFTKSESALPSTVVRAPEVAPEEASQYSQDLFEHDGDVLEKAFGLSPLI